MPTPFRELRFAIRRLARAPLVSALAILSFAVGIGATTTVYTWARALLLDPFPLVRDGHALMALNITDAREGHIGLSYPLYRDLRDRGRAAAAIVVMRPTVLGLGGGSPVRVYAQIVSGNYFDVMGVVPSLGRGFLPQEDEVPLRDAVVVISHRLWVDRFGADRSAIGRTVQLNGHPFTIVGVAPPGFLGTQAGLAYDAWVPIMMEHWVEPASPTRLDERGNRWLTALARLAPGVSRERAEAELGAIEAALDAEHPENAIDGTGIDLAPLWRAPRTVAEVVGPILAVLGAIVVLVLVIASSNVAHLLLARAAGRRHEFAVRVAMGASRGQLVRHLLTESIVLALAGGALGLGLAALAGNALLSLLPSTDFPLHVGGRIDRAALLVALGLATASGLLFGLAPALQASRSVPAATLRATASRSGPGVGRWFKGLVGIQVALSVVLLVAAALFLRSLERARAYDVGFEPSGVLLTSMELVTSGYDRARGGRFFDDLLADVRALPGVSSAALVRRVPLGLGGGSNSTTILVDGFASTDRDPPFTFLNVISSDYFRTMGTRVLRGREFDARDVAAAPPVVVVNQTLAARYWPGREALGGRLRIGQDWHEVVGVVADSSYRQLGEPPAPFVFLPMTQWYRADMTLAVRTAGRPDALAPAVARTIAARDPELPVFGTRTLAQHIEGAMVRQTIAGRLLTLLGAVGLALAAIGLYGTLAFGVGQRTREIGIRMAVGGRPGAVVRMVLRDGLLVVGVGSVLGLLAAVGLARALSSLLLGVPPWDPVALAVVVSVLGFAAATACALPAWRAATIDPVRALREE